MAHIIWDWNGTLMDDFGLLLAAANSTLVAHGGEAVDVHRYRSSFRRPVHLFYAELLERDVSGEEWERLDAHFHAHYSANLESVALSAGATDVLAAIASEGHTQSVLSMWFHRQLVPFVEARGVAQHFVRIDGRPADAPAGSKTPHLARHISALHLDSCELSGLVMIGDTVDDADAATDNGIPIVLYAGGEFDAERLAATGAPVAATLTQAAEMAGVLHR
jgi:phosphoglycolate phosphatase-like HAD superfamily hydrolase